MLFRVGGPETVRGFDYGTRIGRSVWAGQFDLALLPSGLITPVVFADAGNSTLSGKPLVGVGGGVSFFGGFARLNLSAGVQPHTGLRFDLLFRTAR
jgi:hemolysin activation/secretion protein